MRVSYRSQKGSGIIWNIYAVPISLNGFATHFKDELNIDNSLIKTYQNFFSSSNIINLLNDEFKNSIFISLDNKKRAYLFYFTK